MKKYQNILFCTDFSEDANIAFMHAINLARSHGARLHILHVPHSPFTYARHIVDEDIPEGQSTEGQAFYDESIAVQAEKRLRETYQDLLGGYLDVVFIVKCGAPDVEIARYERAHDIDLIVMGCEGKSEYDRLVHGSTVAKVAKLAHCQVMPIRHPGKQYTLPSKGQRP